MPPMGSNTQSTDIVIHTMRQLNRYQMRMSFMDREALDYIRWEIARAVCAGSIGPMEVDAFARHVAATIVDGACALRAALLS